MSGHTPGPYEVQPLQSSHGAELAIVAPANGFVVAVIQYDPDIQTDDYPDYDTVVRHPQDVANAQLLAAAPDFAAAAKSASEAIDDLIHALYFEHIDDRHPNTIQRGKDAMNALRAALAKSKDRA
jgi:hypothetical protein